MEHPSATLGRARKQWHDQLDGLRDGIPGEIALVAEAARVYLDELRKAHPDDREYARVYAQVLAELDAALLAFSDKLPEWDRARLRSGIIKTK